MKLKDVRADRCRTVRELADLAQVAPSTVFLVENGRSVPRQRAMRQLSDALGVRPQDVVEFRRGIEQIKTGDPRRAGGARGAAD
jgi:transcriptional regulator with XRE-family HTH domain